MILESHARTAAHNFQRSGCYEKTLLAILHDARMTMHTGRLPNLLSRGGKGVYPWLAMLRDHLPTTTDADQLTRLRTAGRPTGLIFTNDRCSLLYMNGCELSTFECRIHHAIGKESICLLYTSPSPRDMRRSRMPSSA